MPLERRESIGTVAAMKFVLATLAVLALSALICAGLIAAATGHGMMLAVVATLVFLGMFIRYGCLAH